MAIRRAVWTRRLLRAGAAVLALYLAGLAVLYVAISQPPRTAGKALSYLPGPVFAILPMQRMWTRARDGRLRVGDPAPDFTLPTLDGTEQVRLSSLRGGRPVVLVFGSYT
jgi:hypothetical protein